MKKIQLTTDAVIIQDNKLLLIKRRKNPFSGVWALPGGFIEYGERVEESVAREAREETGLLVKPVKLIGVYSDPKRDPRGHFISLAYLCETKGGRLKAGDDAAEAGWWPLDSLPELAFDHALMVRDAKRLFRSNRG